MRGFISICKCNGVDYYKPRLDSPKTLKIGWYEKAFRREKKALTADDRFIDVELEA